MPSRAYTSFLPIDDLYEKLDSLEVSMPSRAYTSFLPDYTPQIHVIWYRVNALSGLYLISTETIGE